jgi:subtilisin-like proprotein convertase family protein
VTLDVTNRLISAAALAAAALALSSAPAFAVRPAAPAGGRGELDVRAGERTPVPAAIRAARAALARRLGPQSLVAVDPVGGGVRALGRTDGFLSGPRAGDAAAVALAYVRAHADVFGLGVGDVAALRPLARYRSDDGVTHLTWAPTSDGIPAYDSTLSVHVSRDGRVIAANGPPLGGLAVPTAAPKLSPSQALGAAQADLGAPMTFPAAHTRAGAERTTTFTNGDHAGLVAFAAPAGDRLAWRLTVAGSGPYVYDEVLDAQTGAVLARHSLTRFAVSHADVFPFHPGAAPALHDGGTAQQVDIAPWLANPAGSTLSGPFAHAYADLNDDDIAQPGEEIGPSSGTDWIYPQDQAVVPGTDSHGVLQHCAPFGPPAGICTWNGATGASEATNRAQVTTQLFYDVNAYHDWLEQPAVGFTNASGNFELGGTGGSDPVQAEADDSIQATQANVNNANMSTPPDGQSPTMQMYLFKSPYPAVNGGDDASIVFHEYTHGLSNRLIGNGDGLTQRQPQAMGEGWSDWYAMDYLVANGFLADTAANGEVAVGAYATGDPVHGIRFQALDCAVGSSAVACGGSENAGHAGGFTFADLGRVGGYDAATPRFEVHDDGEIWSETLWDLRTALGATSARELITNAMRLSPPNPSYLDERDAILEADEADFAGAHRAQIWQVFAVRGMGYGARTASPSATRAVASFATPALATVASTTVGDTGLPTGDGNGVPEPGETATLAVALRNPALVALTGVHATLSSAVPGVDVQSGQVDYGTIAAGDAHAAPPFAVALGRTLACGAQIPLTLHVTSDQGAIDLPVGVSLGAGRSVVSSTDAPQPIPDASPGTGASSTLSVPSGGRIDQLRVIVSIAHTYDGDLSASLTAPGGRSVELFELPGNGPNGAARAGFSSVTFDDAAGPEIQDVANGNGAAVTGSFRPDEPLTAFAGQDRAGTWTLRVTDSFAQDVGSITGWSLDTDQPACTPLQAAAGGGPPGAGASGGAHGTRATVSHRAVKLRLDARARFAFTFTAAPAGLHGKVRFALPRRGHAPPLALGSMRFTTSRTGRVRLVLTVHGRALRRLRQLRTGRVIVTIALGGRTFRSTFKLTAPQPPRRPHAAALPRPRRG